MKLLELVFLVLLVANVTFATTTGLANWSITDFKNFLNDRKIKYYSSASYNDLKALAEAEFDKLKSNTKVPVDVNDKKQQHILHLATDPKASLNELLPFHNWDFLNSGDKKPDNEVKNWIFDSWNKPALQKFLKSGKISFKSGDSKKELIDKAIENWDKIVKNFEVSGKYPGDWLYAEWSESDLKDWLNSYDVPFNAKAKREELVDEVKKYSRSASLSVKDSRDSLLESLNLFESDLFDKKNKLKDEFFENWTYSQLREWLYYVGIIDSKPGVYVKDLTPQKLKSIAQKNKDYFVSDIKGYTDKLKEYANPFISKDSANSKATGDVINDTFLISIDKWSKDRLKEFLKARDVNFSPFLSKKQLVELAKQSKSLSVKGKDNANKWVSDALNVDYYSDLLNSKGYKDNEKPFEVISFFKEQFSSNPSDGFATRKEYYKPDLDEYRRYVHSQLQKTNKNAKLPDEKSIKDAFSVVNEYYKKATEVIGDSYDGVKNNADEALNEAENAAYEYSLSFLNDYKARKSQISGELESAKIAASNFAADLSSRLARKYRNAQSSIGRYSDNLLQYFSVLTDHVKQLFYHVIHTVTRANKHVQNEVEVYSASGKESLGKYKDAVKQKSNAVYESGKEYIDDTASNAEKKYADVHNAAVQYGSQATGQVKNSYDSISRKISETWQSALSFYTNADLKAYLSTFGFDYKSLDRLSRYQLLTLARIQTDLFWGGTKTKWDKSIPEIYHDVSDDILLALGLKKNKSASWYEFYK